MQKVPFSSIFPLIGAFALTALSVLPVSSRQIVLPTLVTVSAEYKEDSFHKKFRTQKYDAYPPVRSTSTWMKTGDYNQFENPTGMFFSEGEEIVVEVGGNNKEPLELRISDFSTAEWKDSVYPLKSGKNTLKVKNSGHGYINHFTDNYKKTPAAQITFLSGGKANGYFDGSLHSNEDWKKLLNEAVSPIMDIRGKYVQLAYPVKALKEQCPDDGLALAGIYDKIIDMQHQLMGLVKYDCRPKNRMFGRVIWQGFMHADGVGAAFHNDTMPSVANVDGIIKESWGIAHEFGHVNQTRPGMKWVATTEVTNNIFSIWTKYKLSPEFLTIEHYKMNDGADNIVEGGRFNAYLNAALVNNEPWLCQKGPDRMTDYHSGNSDHFVKLCPLWQLQLYFAAAGKGNSDLYADIFQITRKTDDAAFTHGQHQLNFLRRACDVTKQDLTDFFKKTGMLTPLDKEMLDYTNGHMTITQKDCDDLVKYAQKYPKPESPVIEYITSASVDAYKNRLPVTGEFGKGVTKDNNDLVVSREDWKNVTVFEAYKGEKRERIAIVTTGSPDKSSTRIPFPEGSTRLEAVAWDGTRTLVYGAR